MALTKCKECGKDVSDQADKCPSCGVAIKKKGGCGRTAVIIFGLIVLVLFVLPAVCLLSKRPSAEKPLALGRITVGCDTTAVVLMERLHKKRPVMEALAEKGRRWSAQLSKALDEGRPGQRWRQSSDDAAAEAKFYEAADSCGKLIAGKLQGLEPGRDVLLSFVWLNVECIVRFSAFVNYEARTQRNDIPRLGEVKADLTDAARQLAPKLFACYPRLEYVELNVIHRKWTLATLGLGRKATGILGDSLLLYKDACAANVRGLTYGDKTSKAAFVYQPNQWLVKMGKLR